MERVFVQVVCICTQQQSADRRARDVVDPRDHFDSDCNNCGASGCAGDYSREKRAVSKSLGDSRKPAAAPARDCFGCGHPDPVSLIELQDGMVKLVIAHSAFCTPFAFLPIRARLQGMSLDFEEAATDLYASRWVVFRRVTLPLIFPGLFSGAMLAFLISMDNFITSNMLSSGGTTTLPVFIFSLIRAGTTPELNAIGTMLIVGSVVLATIALTIAARGKNDNP